MTPQDPWNHYIITRFAIRRGQVFHLKWWCLYLDIICSCKTRVLIENSSHLFQVKQKKLFYLFRPFTSVLWHALLGVFVLPTISYIFLQYFASKLRNTAQNKWLQNCKSATWQVAQIWLLQGEFYPTRLTSHGQSFFLSIYSIASVCSLTRHKKRKLSLKPIPIFPEQIKLRTSKSRNDFAYLWYDRIHSLCFDFTGWTEKHGLWSVRLTTGIIALCSVVISAKYSGNLIASLTGNISPLKINYISICQNVATNICLSLYVYNGSKF